MDGGGVGRWRIRITDPVVSTFLKEEPAWPLRRNSQANYQSRSLWFTGSIVRC